MLTYNNGPLIEIPDTVKIIIINNNEYLQGKKLKKISERYKDYIYNLFCRNGENLDITALDRKKLAEQLAKNSK